jgi:arsenate reductase (thioredoxin)
MSTRNLTAVLVAISSIAAIPPTPVLAQQLSGRPTDKKTIVFVCEHGSAKSVIAAAHFNDLAQRNGIPYIATARGINPEKEIPPYIRAGLTRESLDIKGWQPRPFAQQDAVRAERVITLGCALPSSVSVRPNRLQNWNDVPFPRDNYRNASQAIAGKVASLLRELADTQKQWP